MSLRSGVALLLVAAAGCTRQSPAPEQANGSAPTAVAPVAPVAGAVDRSYKGEAPPAARLTGLDGKPATLPTAKPLLVNLWATWCAPCLAELPALDRAAGLRANRLTVVAVDQGDDAAKVQAFLRGKPLAHARPLLDHDMAASLKLAANLPTTILYDAGGKEVWRVTGGRDWTSAESLKLLDEAR